MAEKERKGGDRGTIAKHQLACYYLFRFFKHIIVVCVSAKVYMCRSVLSFHHVSSRLELKSSDRMEDALTCSAILLSLCHFISHHLTGW